MSRPQSLSEVLRRNPVDPWIGLDEFLDEFYNAHGDKIVQQTMLDMVPALVGDIYIDAYVAAVGEHLAMRWGLQIPDWVHEEPRLGSGYPTFTPDLTELRPIFLVESPYAFRRRNIFTSREPLQRARWPKEEPLVEPLGPSL